MMSTRINIRISLALKYLTFMSNWIYIDHKGNKFKPMSVFDQDIIDAMELFLNCDATYDAFKVKRNVNLIRDGVVKSTWTLIPELKIMTIMCIADHRNNRFFHLDNAPKYLWEGNDPIGILTNLPSLRIKPESLN